MTQITVRVPAHRGDAAVREYAAAALGVSPEAVGGITILRRSVDARRRGAAVFVYTLAAEAPGASGGIPYIPAERYTFPADTAPRAGRPVVVGMGPAGLFAALCLAEAGVPCLILERGRPVERRVRDVERFWQTGALDAQSNVQFGEGGAGTFSDGKLTTGITDPRLRFILEAFVRFGAPEDILYLSKPHIGTDRLRGVVRNMRGRLLELGCEIRFGHQLCDIEVSAGALAGITVQDGARRYAERCGRMLLAPGNSARDVFRLLARRGVTLTAKPFSAGVRIEHLQREIDLAQYGRAPGGLPASDYKLAVHLESGRSVYTFCVCPGGRVVAAASAPGGVVTNGMSEYARDGASCNGGLLVSVTPEDWGGDALGGLAFQEELERRAFEAGGGNYFAPAQLAGDFLARRPSAGYKDIRPSYLPGVRYCNLWEVLPEFICASLAEALPLMARRVRGFANPDAVLTAVETRSSSPVRIERMDYAAAGVSGLYPCGEGAGYAGGIMSAAADGIRAAEALYRSWV